MAERKTTGGEFKLDGKSPIRAAILAALIEAPGHGWDVARRAHLRLGSSWGVDAKHVYSYLRRLLADELIRVEREPSDRPPYALDVYYPTEKGKQARRAWLAAPPQAKVVRGDLNIRLGFSTEEDTPELLRAFEERRLDVLEELEENEARATPEVSYAGLVISLQCSAADKRLNAEKDWIDEVCRKLEERREKRAR